MNRSIDLDQAGEAKRAEAAAQNEESRRRLLEVRRKRATADSRVSEEDKLAAEIDREEAEDNARHQAQLGDLLAK